MLAGDAPHFGATTMFFYLALAFGAQVNITISRDPFSILAFHILFA
jgi:hypothetical protein